ncbi:MAG: hypothetical protein ABIQ86_14595 [Steroidobacteraceae bacterium]
MSELPRHTSLEHEFRAAVKLTRAPWTRRLQWWLVMKCMRLRLVQKLIEKRYGT